MLHSESLAKISPALQRAQSEMEHADKSKTNPHFRSKYADLAGVVDTIKPVLAKHGLCYLQGFIPSESGVVVETRILHESGEFIQDEGLFLPLDKQNAQGVGSAVTYGRRYALMALLGVAPDDDDDGNAASAASKPAQSRSKPSLAPKPGPTKPQKVTPEQAAELEAAAIAAGVDPSVAEAKARLTNADKFVATLEKFKNQAKGTNNDN